MVYLLYSGTRLIGVFKKKKSAKAYAKATFGISKSNMKSFFIVPEKVF